MHLLPCPDCHAPIPVSPSQAGDRTQCPSCQKSVDIPKLGELRQLPLAEANDGARIASKPAAQENSSANRIGFVLLGLIAVASLLIAGFCGIRWALIDVPTTTDKHIAILREQYKTLNPAELVREYEQMETYGLDLPVAYGYKQTELEKYGWGRNAAIAAAIGGIAVLGAIFLSLAGSANRRPSADT